MNFSVEDIDHFWSHVVGINLLLHRWFPYFIFSSPRLSSWHRFRTCTMFRLWQWRSPSSPLAEGLLAFWRAHWVEGCIALMVDVSTILSGRRLEVGFPIFVALGCERLVGGFLSCVACADGARALLLQPGGTLLNRHASREWPLCVWVGAALGNVERWSGLLDAWACSCYLLKLTVCTGWNSDGIIGVRLLQGGCLFIVWKLGSRVCDEVVIRGLKFSSLSEIILIHSLGYNITLAFWNLCLGKVIIKHRNRRCRRYSWCLIFNVDLNLVLKQTVALYMLLFTDDLFLFLISLWVIQIQWLYADLTWSHN